MTDPAGLRGRRVLVTGACGLIGRAVVSHLAREGASVDGFDRKGGVPPSELHNFRSGSVTDPERVREIVTGYDDVVHLAGLAGLDQGTPQEIYAVNTLGTFLVLETAASSGARRLVYASSINANGLPLNPAPVRPSRYPWGEDEPSVIADAYSLSKQANEFAAQAIGRRYGVSVCGLRYPLVRDIYERDGLVFAAHIRAALRADPRRQACEGWSYLDVRDAARATAAALTHEAPPQPGVLIAAPRTYLRVDTAEALDRVMPEVARVGVAGRNVPLDLSRASRLLEFTATHALEDIDPALLAELEGHP